MAQWEPLTDFEDEFVIETEPPHRIRRVWDGFMPKISLCKGTGYYQVCLNKRTYPYHRILAKHFIPNPDDLPEVDHIDRDKRNNSLDNLRWVNRSQNLSNRSKFTRQKREFLDHAPNDIIEIRIFNDFEYPENRYYFCGENDRVVMRVNDHKWQWLAQTPHNGYVNISMRDINGRYHQVYAHKLINHFRNEPAADAENVDE